MRNPDCRKYDECLDKAAHGLMKMDCEKCKDIGMDEKEVNTEWPESDPDYFRFRGGEKMTTKICSSPNCKHGGEPQDIERFPKHPTNKDGYAGVCKDCKNDQNAARIIRKRTGLM